MYPRHPGVAHVDGCLTTDPGEEIEICVLAHFRHSNGSGSAVGSFSLQVKPEASRPGLRPFDGVSLAGDGGVKWSVAVNSHSNPDAPLEHVQLLLIFTGGTALFYETLCRILLSKTVGICGGRGAGQRGAVENEGQHFQRVSSCSTQVRVTPTKSQQKPPDLGQHFWFDTLETKHTSTLSG